MSKVIRATTPSERTAVGQRLTCTGCGTVFDIEPNDDFEVWDSWGLGRRHFMCPCPTCGTKASKSVYVGTIPRDGEEPDL